MMLAYMQVSSLVESLGWSEVVFRTHQPLCASQNKDVTVLEGSVVDDTQPLVVDDVLITFKENLSESLILFYKTISCNNAGWANVISASTLYFKSSYQVQLSVLLKDTDKTCLWKYVGSKDEYFLCITAFTLLMTKVTFYDMSFQY